MLEEHKHNTYLSTIKQIRVKIKELKETLKKLIKHQNKI